MAPWIYTIIVLALLEYTTGQSSCNFRQYISPGVKFTIQSPNYPNFYEPSQSCTWTAVTRSDANVFLQCDFVHLGVGDYLFVSNTGHLTDGRQYYDPFETKGNTIIMQLVSTPSWRGGLFRCSIWAEKENQPNQDANCDCGYSYRTRIVGGVDAGVNEFPSMAALVDKSESFFCGATIIARRVALTAAHAVLNRNPNEHHLLVGEHDTSTKFETNVTRSIGITAFIPHEKFQFNKGLYDIALIITTQTIEFSAKVGPACLPFHLKGNLVQEYVEVVGWGLTSFAGWHSDVLQKTVLQVIPPQECQKEYGNTFSDPQHLCTFFRGRDACQRDSGGPLYYRNPYDNRMYVVGVVNMGKFCGDKYPAVNARVAYFIDWINSKVPSAGFCVK